MRSEFRDTEGHLVLWKCDYIQLTMTLLCKTIGRSKSAVHSLTRDRDGTPLWPWRRTGGPGSEQSENIVGAAQ